MFASRSEVVCDRGSFRSEIDTAKGSSVALGDETRDVGLIRHAFTLLEEGVWIGTARSGETLYMNERFGELLHVGREDGAHPGLLSVTDEPIEVDNLPFERARRTGTTINFEDVGVRMSDGTRSRLRLRAIPFHDAAGQVSHVMVTAVDVAAELGARAESSVTQDRIALAVRNAPVAFWSVDATGIVTMSEGALLHKLGVLPGDLVGKSVLEIYAEHPTIPRDIRRALAGESVTYTSEVGDVMLETWLCPVLNAAEEPSGAVGVSTDITERIRMQRELVQSDRGFALGTLVASVAHEINNPLTYTMFALNQVRAAVAQLASSESDEARSACLQQVLTPLEIAEDGLRSISIVTQDLRSFSRTDDGTSTVDVRTAAQSALRLVAKDLEARVRVVVDLNEVPLVLATEARLIQVFVNLLLNAVQALANERGERVVTLSTCTVDCAAVVIVSDNGPGVPHALRERIFEPFVTTKPAGLGMGVGLFVCRNIVRGLGGEITVEDRHGGGAAFRVRLPAASGALATSTELGPPLPVARLGRDARILVVDDDVLVGAALGEALRQAGHSVTVVDDTDEAIALLVATPPFDLCFCDLMMHGAASMEVFAAVAERTPGRERDIVYMTGGAFSPEAQRFFAERGDSAVEKPFDIAKEAAKRLGQRLP